ncbi:hypothetical protein [Pediococcus claussenii]|nr:hypothetical protein [Pediococcus claussenii]
MSKELIGVIIAMIIGTVWVFSSFSGALLVALMGILGFVLVKYGTLLISQILAELRSALNLDDKR